MRNLEYRLARATRLRSRRRPWTVASLAMCAAAAVALVAADGWRGANFPVFALRTAVADPPLPGREAIALPTAPTLVATTEAHRVSQATDALSTAMAFGPARAPQDSAAPRPQRSTSGVLFEQTSLFDAIVPIEQAGALALEFPGRKAPSGGDLPRAKLAADATSPHADSRAPAR